MLLEQLYAVSMMLLEITETCIFKHAIVLKVSALLHTEIWGDFRGAPGYWVFLRPTLSWM